METLEAKSIQLLLWAIFNATWQHACNTYSSIQHKRHSFYNGLKVYSFNYSDLVEGPMPPDTFHYIEIGGNMRDVSFTLNQLHFKHFPVCNIFKPKIYKNQVCYEVDINLYGDSTSRFTRGLIFLMDYNVDRQFVNIQRGYPKLGVKTNNLRTIVDNSEDLSNEASVIIQTIGKFREGGRVFMLFREMRIFG